MRDLIDADEPCGTALPIVGTASTGDTGGMHCQRDDPDLSRDGAYLSEGCARGPVGLPYKLEALLPGVMSADGGTEDHAW